MWVYSGTGPEGGGKKMPAGVRSEASILYRTEDMAVRSWAPVGFRVESCWMGDFGLTLTGPLDRGDEVSGEERLLGGGEYGGEGEG